MKPADSAHDAELAGAADAGSNTRGASVAPGSRDALEAMLARMMPVILALLADGVPRSRRAIVAALADRHDRKEVGYAVMRLSVTGRIVDHQGRFILAPDEDDGSSAAG